jgi:hypothetical protein
MFWLSGIAVKMEDYGRVIGRSGTPDVASPEGAW